MVYVVTYYDEGSDDVVGVYATLGGAMGHVGKPAEKWDCVDDNHWSLGYYDIRAYELGA